MFSVKSAIKLAAIAGAGIAMLAGVSANAGVVIKSSGPSAAQYPVGKKVDDDGRITLKNGDSVTIMSNGGTREIKGAGTHRVAQRGISKVSTFAALTKQRSNARVRTGATRAPQGEASLVRPNIWYLDVSQSGAMCVTDLSSVRMWRPGREMATTYVIANATSADHLHVNFPENSMLADWDASRMPLAAATEYSITGPGSADPVVITFVTIDAVPDAPEDLAALLIENNCTGQLELLATKMM